jgi:hypothetical protein
MSVKDGCVLDKQMDQYKSRVDKIMRIKIERRNMIFLLMARTRLAGTTEQYFLPSDYHQLS